MADVVGTQEVSIWNKDETKAVSVVTDGSIERLAVSAKEQPATNYQLKSIKNVAGVSVGTSDVTLASYTGAGTIDFIAITDATSSDYEVAIVVDGTERLRLTMSQIGSTLGLTSGSSSPIWAETANKAYRYRPFGSVGFSTGFSVVARAGSGKRTLYFLVFYREQIV